MDFLSANWLTDMVQQEMEDVAFIQQQFGSMQEMGDLIIGEFDCCLGNFPSPPGSPNLSNSTLANIQTGVVLVAEKPTSDAQLKNPSGKFGPEVAAASSSSSPSCLISFSNPDSNKMESDDMFTIYRDISWKGKPKDGAAASASMDLESFLTTYDQGTNKRQSLTRDPLQNQEHVLAERKRREKINMLFSSLSAIVPGLTKRDKTTVLGEAIKYMKQLQERVKMLEEKRGKKMVESVVSVKRVVQVLDDGITCASYDSSLDDDQPLLQIDVRVSNMKDVLIRIHCEKRKGFGVRIHGELERLHLTIINTSFIPFADYIMDITIVAQMEHGFSVTAKDVVRNLRQAFLQVM